MRARAESKQQRRGKRKKTHEAGKQESAKKYMPGKDTGEGDGDGETEAKREGAGLERCRSRGEGRFLRFLKGIPTSHVFRDPRP
jgi:hypothetical protein